MTGDWSARLRPVPAGADPAGRLLADLPPGWHGDVIGPGIEDWESVGESGRDRALHLEGVPGRLRREIAWMAHWQHLDGLKVPVDTCNQLASLLAWAAGAGHVLPESLARADKQDLLRLHGVWFHGRPGRLPAEDSGSRRRLGRLLGYPRLALAARLHDGAWWELDTWHPRCDPHIPLRPREPGRSVGSSPGEARIPWVRDAVKWHLSVLLESGTLTWSTLTCQRSQALLRFARWLESLPDPAAAAGDLQQAGVFAADFRRWAADPANRSSVNRTPAEVSARKVNLDLWSVATLMTFLADHRQEAAQILGPTPWDGLTDAHSAIWLRQRTRIRRSEPLTGEPSYVDDHALAQITACLPVLGELAGQPVTVATGSGERMLPGQGDPQLMRLLLQILTGRRASEICLCPFDCLSPATGSAIEAAEGEAVARFRYGQSKTDAAPDTIFVDAEAVAVIEEQQQWLRGRSPGRDVPYLFPQRRANAHAAKHYGTSNYGRSLALFSKLAQVTDASGQPVKLSHAHRFRHTKFTKLEGRGVASDATFPGKCEGALPGLQQREVTRRVRQRGRQSSADLRCQDPVVPGSTMRHPVRLRQMSA
jgi:integrase